jgi:alpha-L-fucosidase
MNRRSFLEISATTVAKTVATSVATSLTACARPRSGDLSSLTRPRPSQAQLDWQRDELALFLHFGVNTYTDREWGDGRENPSIFDPSRLDARQWTRAARSAGARALILTAKHHDGFCLWSTRTTQHSVAKSPWRSGQGDVVREFVNACRAEGMKAGLYLSPWDRNNPLYGDSPRYNDLYCDQLTELLTQYGTISEVWFDGANGEGPNGRRQVYDWPRVFALVRKLQPSAVMFSDAGPDVRWCGNENGVAGEPNWSTVNPAVVMYPGANGPGVSEALLHGDPGGSVWRPAEVDVSIRPGWFNHESEDSRVRSVDNLVNLYFSSVGRNGKLLLNVPPTKSGWLHTIDVARLTGLRERLNTMFAHDLAATARRTWRTSGPRSAELELDLGKAIPVSIARLQEEIAHGQSVAKYTLYGASDDAWRVLSRGTTIGYTKLDRFAPTPVRRIKVVIDDAMATPEPITLGVYGPE